MTKFLNCLLILTTVTVSFVFAVENEWTNTSDTLQAVHVVFRHGDRTPDDYCFDWFNISHSVYEYTGIGQLTNNGKYREYLIGITLRQKYDSFLGELYYPGIVQARSTDYDRTKASLLLVLAGLFPPSVSEIWNYELLWQAIPIEYENVKNDLLMRYPTNCDKYKRKYFEVLNSPKIQYIIKAKRSLFEYVKKHLILEKRASIFNSPIEGLFATYFCLKAMEDTGLDLPKWTKPVYPEILKEMTVLEYHIKAINNQLIQFTGGYLFNKIIKDTEALIKGELQPKGRKLYLYSGHEFNVALLLLAVDSFPPDVPNYGSFVVVELHKINDVYGFKFFYQNYVTEDPIPFTIPECDAFCPLKDFKNLMKNRLPPLNLTCDITSFV